MILYAQLRFAKKCILLMALAIGSASIAFALSPVPQINARSAALIDQATGTILYAKNPDMLLSPASLTKLVTLHIAYEEIAAGRLSFDELVDIDKRDCSPYIPYGSSVMYLRPGMKVSVRDLMLGCAVVSGNDAAYSLARRIAGSNEAFAARMNQAAKLLGFSSFSFVEPSGIDEHAMITAREFALFCRSYITAHPQAIAELHSVKSIDFPREEHGAPGFVPKATTVQYNRNPLIFSYPGADGLKTGYIIEVGFNMAGTAKRDATRFIVVTLGGSGASYAGGGAQRSRDTAALLDWAFENFVTISLNPGPLPEPRVWYGKTQKLALKIAGEAALTLPVADAAQAKARIEAPSSLEAPLAAGTKIGRIVYSARGKDLYSVDLVAAIGIEKGGFFRRIWDGAAKFFTALFGNKK